jgi:hypothetical protein
MVRSELPFRDVTNGTTARARMAVHFPDRGKSVFTSVKRELGGRLAAGSKDRPNGRPIIGLVGTSAAAPPWPQRTLRLSLPAPEAGDRRQVKRRHVRAALS